MDEVAALDSEALILVDEADREVGHLSKSKCHDGQGVLHRAFSLLIFNGEGELLLQQRAATKRLWPLYWSNSCCSHPRRAEGMETAIHRRLHEELGLRCPLQFLFKFQYQAQFETAGSEQELGISAPLQFLFKFQYQARFAAAGSERELCSVYIGRSDEPVRSDPQEVQAWRWVTPQALEAEMAGAGMEKFTPWFRLEWARIWREHRAAVLALT
jgi:isopentenyl-diphosphate delta-isomerase